MALLISAGLAVLAGALVPGQAPALPFPPPPPSALQQLADHLARPLAAAPALAAPGARFALAVEAPEGGARFAGYLGDSLLAALGRHGTRAEGGLRGDTAPEGALALDVRAAVSGAHVHATARLVRPPATLWEHLRRPEGEVLATAFASAPLDLEIRLLMGLGPRGARVDRLRAVSVGRRSEPALTASPVTDLLVADLDGDGRVEVAVLQPGRVTAAAWEGGALRALHTRTLDDLPPSPARLRPPVGRLVALTRPDGTRALLAADAGRARAALLVLGDDGWRSAGTAPDGWPLYATGVDAWLAAPWPAGVDVLEGALVEVRLRPAGAATATAVGPLEPSYDLRAWPHQGAASPAWSPVLVAAQVPRGVALWGAADPDRVAAFEGAGTVAAVTDLDADGDAEVLLTGPAPEGPDTLGLYTVAGSRDPRRAWRGSTPAPVTAAASGDLDGDGFDEILLATWAEPRGDLVVVAPQVR